MIRDQKSDHPSEERPRVNVPIHESHTFLLTQGVAIKECVVKSVEIVRFRFVLDLRGTSESGLGVREC